VLYLDTSAFLKLLVAEKHSAATRRHLRGADLWSSVLLDVEAHRAGRRLGVSAAVVDDHLEAVTLVALSDSTIRTGRFIGSDGLRTLDALHLAAATELEADLEAVVTFDRRLAGACAAEQITVVTPGLPKQWWA
jgi:uncharacterized protein